LIVVVYLTYILTYILVLDSFFIVIAILPLLLTFRLPSYLLSRRLPRGGWLPPPLDFVLG